MIDIAIFKQSLFQKYQKITKWQMCQSCSNFHNQCLCEVFPHKAAPKAHSQVKKLVPACQIFWAQGSCEVMAIFISMLFITWLMN